MESFTNCLNTDACSHSIIEQNTRLSQEENNIIIRNETDGENVNESKEIPCVESKKGNLEEMNKTLLRNNLPSCEDIKNDPINSIVLNTPNDYANEIKTENQSDTVSTPENIKIENYSDPNQPSSLALLAQYDTDENSSDDVCEVPQAYQTRCIEIDSDSSTSEVEFLSEIRSSIDLDRLNDDLGAEEDDDEEGNIRNKRQPKVKGELDLEDLPPIEDLHITVPEEECTELGKIHSIVEQLVLVNALPGTVPLDLETILFRDKGKLVLGEVFDVLGQVSDPIYCVRFNSNKEIKEKGIEVGQTVYVAPRTKHTQFIVLANLMKMRGSDASWENDVEPPPRFIDYSDDEEERAARRPNRKRQSSSCSTSSGRGSYTPRRSFRGNYGGNGAGGVLRHQHPNQQNYNIIGSSWHSNYNQTPMINPSQYRFSGHSHGGYVRPSLNSSPYQQPTTMNSDVVLNPYAVYPPSQMQQSLPPPHYQQHRPY